MEALPVFAAGLGLSLSLIVVIGAQNAFVLRQGLRREHLGAVVALCVALDVLLMTLGVSGLAAGLGRHPAALDALALGGAGFLGVYGLQAAHRAWRPRGLAPGLGEGGQPRARVLAQALAVTLLNPHVYLDTVLLVGSVGAQQPEGARAVFLAGACTASGVWFSALGFGARRFAPTLARPGAWRVIDGAMAATMLGLGGVLAWPLLR